MNYKFKFSREADGAITLFLSLILVVVISLVCTIAESTRVYLAMVHSKSQAYRAVETGFSGFARQLFDDYGIIALFEQESFDEQIKSNIEMENTSGDGYANLIQTNLEAVERVGIKKITDCGGKCFTDQVLEYEKYEVTEETINLLISKYRKYKDKESDSKTEEQEHVDDYDSASSDASEEYMDAVGIVKELDFDTNNLDAEQALTVFTSAEYSIEEAIKACDAYISERDEIEKKYGKAPNKLYEDENKACLKEMQLQIENIKAEYKKCVEDVLFDDSETDDSETGGTGNGDSKSGDSESGDSETGDSEIDEVEIGRQQFLAGLNEYKAEVINNRDKLVVVKPKDDEETKKNQGILDVAKKLIEEGAIGLVIPSDMELSKNTVKKDKLPTTVCKNKKGNDSLDDMWNKAWYIAYINNNFGNVLSAKDNTALKYEMEYIVGGKDNDKSNLESVVGEMLLIRQVSNNITLISDKTKMETLSLLAGTISCSMCMPYLEPLIKIILIEAWALAESIMDVRTLLAGGEVSLIKSSSEWKTSLENLLAEIVCNKSKSEDKEKFVRQDYNMYLLLLLFAKGTENLTYRVLDLIQLNLAKRYNSDFEINKCLVAAEYDVTFKIPRVFVTLPVTEENRDSDGYEIKVRTGYAY